MNTFTWLLIGHLVGDWVLQNDWMARGKKHSLVTLAGMVHFAVYTAVISGAFWLSDAGDKSLALYLILGIVIFVSHWLIDATSVVDKWMRFYRQSNLTMVRVMVDQTCHILILAAIAYPSF
ncbi:MAG: DUF3307 domain-containing protein [Planctomycetes bacterium]|nr:DUF3307 domain-containing protein [Planctomycetota bacterium]